MLSLWFCCCCCCCCCFVVVAVVLLLFCCCCCCCCCLSVSKFVIKMIPTQFIFRSTILAVHWFFVNLLLLITQIFFLLLSNFLFHRAISKPLSPLFFFSYICFFGGKVLTSSTVADIQFSLFRPVISQGKQK